MTTHATELADWVHAFSLGLMAWGAGSALVLLLAPARASDFDPRPALRRLLATDAGARLTVAFFNAKTAARDAVLDAAALVILLTTSPKGAMT